MTNAPGTKKKNAASTHKLIDDVPLWPAAAIHRGPSTVAILKSRTSQKPIALRSCPMGLALDSGVGVTRSRSSWISHGTHSLVELLVIAVPLALEDFRWVVFFL